MGTTVQAANRITNGLATALPLIFVAMTACSGGQFGLARYPKQVKLGDAREAVAQRCQTANDFETDPQLIDTVTVGMDQLTIRPRRGSHTNSARRLRAGNMIAKITNATDVEYRQWALPANGESCWLVGADPTGEEYVARFVAANETMDTIIPVRVYRHPRPHRRNLARFYGTPRASEDTPGRVPGTVGVGGVDGLFHLTSARPASLALIDGLKPWAACELHSCCEVGGQ